MEEKIRVNYGKRNKNKGNSAERLYAKIFRSLGFSHCRTSREASKLYDDCAIDLIFIPFLIQIKAGRQRSLNPSLVLQSMDERIKASFPATSVEHTLPRIIIHHKDGKSGVKRTEYDTLVTMSFETFRKLLNLEYQEEENESNQSTTEQN